MPLSPADADALDAAFCRWKALTSEAHERCPLCRQLVIVTPSGDANAYAHRAPVCKGWREAFALLGIELTPERRQVARG